MALPVRCVINRLMRETSVLIPGNSLLSRREQRVMALLYIIMRINIKTIIVQG